MGIERIKQLKWRYWSCHKKSNVFLLANLYRLIAHFWEWIVFIYIIFLRVKQFWPNICTTRGKCLLIQYFWHGFNNFRNVKHLLSSMKPSTKTQPSLRYSKINIVKCHEANMVYNNLIRGVDSKWWNTCCLTIGLQCYLKQALLHIMDAFRAM